MPGAVTLTKVGRVALITLNVPTKLNAMTAPLADAFGEIVEKLLDDPSEYGCVVITGAGKAFSAGGDLDWLRLRTSDTPSRNSKIMHDFYNKFLRVRQIPLPVIAAINGHAIGAGFCFAMACDIRIASAKAKLGFTFVGLGLHPGMGATHIIASVAGYETAYRMLLTGDVVSGTEAKELRLCSQVEEDGPTALEAAMSMARRIAAQSPVAVRATVFSLRQKQDMVGGSLESALWREADAQSYGYSSSDCKEGIEAVAEKRKPQFGQYESYADTNPPPKPRL
jgi:enoyl-CoA hydratase/carnithine racemase